MVDDGVRNDIIAYKCQKAHKLMYEVNVLVQNEMWNSSINRMYYACFHIISALLIKHGIEVKSYMGVRQAFGLYSVKSQLIPKECGRIFLKSMINVSQAITMILGNLRKKKLIIYICKYVS